MIVADTHTIFWLTSEPAKLSALASATLLAARVEGETIAISDKTLWELALLIKRNKITPPLPMGQFLRTLESRFTVLPVTADIAEVSMSFSDRYPRDPADRIIGATAVSFGIPLVTKDQAIRESNEVRCIW